MLKTINKVVDSVIGIIMAASLALLSCITFAEVVSRYFLHFSIPWAMDVIRICFVYCVLFGAVAGVKNKAHLNIEVILVTLPERVRHWVEIIIDFIVAVFFIILIVLGKDFVDSAGTQVMPYTEISMRYLYMSIPIAGVLMLYYLIQQIFDKFKTN